MSVTSNWTRFYDLNIQSTHPLMEFQQVFGAPRNGLPESRPYVYRGDGRDELTPDLDEPDDAERLSIRLERIEMLADLRLYEGNHADCVPPGYVTARQAAERLGVSVRTIERYKRDLRKRVS